MWLAFSERWGLNLASGSIQNPIGRAISEFEYGAYRYAKPNERWTLVWFLLHK